MDPEAHLPDPVAYARGLSDQELQAYRTVFGEDSREWLIAQRELRRRAWPLSSRILLRGLFVVGLLLISWVGIRLTLTCLSQHPPS